MKFMLQVLIHVFCALAGFWIASPSDELQLSETTRTTAQNKSTQASRASLVAQSYLPPNAGSEAGMAQLTPENWAEAIQPISKMSLNELPAMLRGILSNPFPDVRMRLMRFLFERWAALDLNGALIALCGISSPQLKERALWPVLDLWTKTDTDAAWKWLNVLKDDSVLQEAGIERLLYLTAAKDPQASAAWADQIEDVFLREKALASIGNSWMDADAKGALAAVTTVEPKRLRDYLLSKICYHDGVDHAAGLEIVSQLPSQVERSWLNKIWLSAYLGDHPQEAFQWLLDHSDRPELQKSADAVGGHFGSTMKSNADLRAMALQLPAGPLRDAFTARAADSWVEAGRSISEAQDLLSLCGPCIERDSAQSTIDSKRP